MMNRMANASNPYQGKFPKTLCVCSAGLLRSPTIAWVLSNPPYSHNTRAVGVNQEYALIPIELVHVEWADEIICADSDHLSAVKELVAKCSNPNKPVHCLHLPDEFRTRDPKLIKYVTEGLNKIYKYEAVH